MKVLLLCALVAVALSQTVAYSKDDEVQWEQFKIKYRKYYESAREEAYRREIFMKNLKLIQEHNKKYENGEVSFKVGVMEWSDLTYEEFKDKHNGFIPPLS